MDQDDCNAVLIPDTLNVMTQSTEAVHYLSIINEATYERIKKQAGASATYPIKGVPVQFGIDYDAFSENRRNYFSSQRHSMNISHSTAFVQSIVPKERVDAWLECKRARHPFGYSVMHVSSHSAIIRFTWNPPPGVLDLPVTGSQVAGGQALSEGVPIGRIFVNGKIFRVGESVDVTFHRSNPTIDLIGSVNLSGYPISFNVAGGSWVVLMRAAIDAGMADVVTSLLDGGCPVDILLDDQLNRPLHLAAERAADKICSILIARGASTIQKNTWGDTPHSIAVARHGIGSATEIATR